MGGLDISKLAAERFEPDTAEANGSSIALLVRFGRWKLLLAGDAHVDRLVASLKRIRKGNEPIAVDLFKVPHHGSAHNLSNELLGLIACKCYVVSTSGAYFKHPSRAAIARILAHGGASKQIFFNYKSQYTQIWDQPSVRTSYTCEMHYCEDGSDGHVRVRLSTR
jgi:beta-lactamase superfamily II metal-dependent hydrolase